MRSFIIAVSVMLPLLAIPGPVSAASFDCTKARAADEVAICRSRDLSDMDVRMATLFEVDTSLVLMGQRGAMHDEQREWLKRRAACGSNVACLKTAYQVRIAELQKAFEDIRASRPF